jgi:FlaG/FlaF family flagellin (archaellin)
MLAIAGSAGAQVGKGKVLFEYWLNIGSGTSVDSNLRTNANFPNNPTQSEWRDSFKSKVDWADNMGTRARAFLTAPADGNYTFWVAGDDNCQLWLSTDDTAANAKMIAQVVGWTGAEEWANATEKANQVSVPQALKAGKVYYIEALLKEGGGGDSVSVGWAGPVIGDKTVVIAGTYLTAFIRNPEPLFKAQSPDPANGKTEVTSPLFQWTAGATAVLHEVYMGTNPTPGAAEFMGPWPVNMYFHVLGLTPGAKYYWRVDEVDASGVKTTGDVWSFTVAPLEAHNPDPTDGMAGRSLSVKLTWVAGQGATKHKVFIGADKAKVTAGDASVLVATQAELTFAPTGLAAKTTYYWRVDEVDSTGKVSPGPVWSFSTIDPAGGAVAEYWNDANLMFFNMDLVGAPAVVKTVPNVDLSWPDGTVKGTNSPDPNVNTNYFFGRFTALLNVPTTGTYTLIESSDDGGVLYLDGVLVAGRWATGGEAEFASADLDLVAGQRYLLTYEYFESTGGAAARIRWSGPGISKQAIWQGALMPPDCAIGPRPRNGAAEVPDRAVMTWIPAPKAVVHTVYFGTDKAKVTAGDASVALPPTAEAKYVPAKALTWNTTYYWKVDEMAADGTTVPGQVWSFKTANFIVVGPSQKTLNYDNTATPFMSQLAYDVPADLTAGSVTDLALRFVGQALTAGTFSYDAATGTYAVGGAGADIWGNADQFTYGYKALQGDGSMIARVVSDDGKGANTWSKAGVMIRETLAAGSTHAFMPITAGGGNGRSFQRRLVADLASTNADGPAPTVTVPRWVKIERKGNDFSAFDSVDGKTWNQIGTAVTIVMKDPVLIGLAVTSHLAGTVRTWTLDSVSTTGNVVPDGPITAWKVINTTQNAVAPLYVAIEDKAGKIAMVNHPNPAAVNTTVIDLWRVPMSSFTGIDLKNAAKMYIGVGDGKAGGSGIMNFADVRIVKPVTLPATGAIDVTIKGDALKGFPDYAGAWPAAEVPANAIDNTTAKYLNFSNSGGTGGKTVMPCGFAVTPAIGATIVTGLTFTAANDSPDRDPINWTLYGSNGTIDGPWETIASGTIDDFSRGSRDRLAIGLDWPRNWKGVTPIGFANTVPFLNYKVQFTSVKRPLVANSMQIAEVELLGATSTAAPKANPIITKVVRAGGTSGNRDPIGVFDGNTQCLPTAPGGLMDGNMVYSDRTYPWNQTPKDLVGAEYVRIFNTDKGTPPATYTVTTSRLATIAVAHDDRNTPAQAPVDKIVAAFAAAGQFKDTGLDVFIYESASTPARPLSVFSADLPAGTYVFASEQSSNTMYIIGAMEKK